MPDPAFVQAKAAVGLINAGADGTSVLDAAPTAGNCLLMLACTLIGTVVIDPYWTLLGSVSLSTYTNGQGTSSRGRAFYYHVVGASESATVPVAHNGGSTAFDLTTDIVEYANLGPVPTFTNPTWTEMSSGSATNYAIPSQTPATGVALLIGAWEVNPNYNPSAPAGWTIRSSTNVGGSRQSTAIIDQVVTGDGATAYDGNATGAGGETAWHTFSVQVLAATPSVGSQVFVI